MVVEGKGTKKERKENQCNSEEDGKSMSKEEYTCSIMLLSKSKMSYPTIFLTQETLKVKYQDTERLLQVYYCCEITLQRKEIPKVIFHI